MLGGIKGFARSLFGADHRDAARRFGYDAVEQQGNKRRQVVSRRRPEDRELTPRQRIQLSSSTRDLQRNFAIAAWAIRKHLDYVSTFTFQADTGDDYLDELLEDLVRWWSRPTNFDAAARLSLPRFTRMAEARRSLDGDGFINFLNDGKTQGIEGDRVIDPRDAVEIPAGLRWEHGVLVNDYGRAFGFAVHKRTGTNGDGLEFERILSPAFCYHHRYGDRWDQVRGVSPLSPACNPLRDVYENFDYALAKAKVSQLFAMAVYREMADEGDGFNPESDADDEGDASGESGEEAKPRYEVNFGKGPIFMDLDPGDRAEILESKTPSEQFQAFTNSMIGVALKSLDIPFSFYDESHTNYSGQRQAWIQYDESAEIKREDNRDFLNWLTARRFAMFVRDGDLELPRTMSLARVLDCCQWVSRGIPWMDPLKEITADIAAIKSGQLGPETAARKRGGDVYRNIDERARVEAYAREKGVVLEYDVVALAQAAAAHAAADAAGDEQPKTPAGGKKKAAA